MPGVTAPSKAGRPRPTSPGELITTPTWLLTAGQMLFPIAFPDVGALDMQRYKHYCVFLALMTEFSLVVFVPQSAGDISYLHYSETFIVVRYGRNVKY